MKTLKSKVKYVLEEYPDTRNSDIFLMIQIWQTYYGVGKTIDIDDLFELPREDNIKRIRAKFNSQGKYWPTDIKIAQGRGINEQEWRNRMGYPHTQETQIPTKEQSYLQKLEQKYAHLKPEVRQQKIKEEFNMKLL